MGLSIDYLDGQTPLDEEEKDGLLIRSITTQAELDELEQRNIEEAILWVTQRRKKFTIVEVLTESFICELHRRMFSAIWRWAGSFRTSEKNIGVQHFQIGVELRKLLDDCMFWVQNEIYSEDEIAVRFKHRIVVIHCFANGNGRHSRLIADIIVEKIFIKEVFSWGNKSNSTGQESRTNYIKALQLADKNEIQSLIRFARS